MSKKDEVYRFLGEMNVPVSENVKKKIENYRYSDKTKISLGADAIEVRTDFDDGQRQYMGISRDGKDAVIRAE